MEPLTQTPLYFWVVFNLMVLFLLALDLGVFHREDHTISVKEALTWSGIWISLSLLFNLGIYFVFGPAKAADYLTGFLLEKSLSVDNLFVMVLIFTYFKVAPKYQHRVLFWGILGALVMRGGMILVGAALIERFHWILYIFGIFLVYTGIKMAVSKDDAEIEPEKNPVIRLVKKIMPVTHDFHGHNFFVKIDGKKFATPLFIALVMVEITDLIFAVDSIPAIFAITTDPFIVYTSNVFAILGLRSLYFALAAIVDKFHYLQMGLAIILSFIGIKMLTAKFYHLPSWVTLTVVIGVLSLSVVASIVWPPKDSDKESVDTAAE